MRIPSEKRTWEERGENGSARSGSREGREMGRERR
jgi:hypothetical protein